MDIQEQGDEWIITDDVSGRVIAVPTALMVGFPELYVRRQVVARCMLNAEQMVGVRIIREGPYGMTPLEMRAKVPSHLWHPEVQHHPTGGPSDLHPTREKKRLALIGKAKLGTLTARERLAPGVTLEHESD